MPERRVKPGFNWVALLCSTMWAYSEGLIVQAGRMTVVDSTVGLLCFPGRPSLFAVAFLLLVGKNIYCARYGSAWLLQRLRDQGYRYVA